MIRKLLLLQLLLFVAHYVCAQVPTTMPVETLRQVKVDNLSDDQIRQLVAEIKQRGVTMGQLDQYAQQNGISAGETQKLKQRITGLNLDTELTGKKAEGKQLTEEDGVLRTVDSQPSTMESVLSPEDLDRQNRRKKIFGAELFSNKSLIFEPNLRLPTPPNYQLATGDEILIDVYGYSEVQHKLKVNTEGYIRIPNLGPVYVNGLTMEEAKERISKQLSTIYSGIRSGNTFVTVSLGGIRSIRVLIIGEVERPATYTLSSLSTVANALYASGGPSLNGSFRSIQVIRNGNTAATFDLYDFLTKGDLRNNIVLRDQDIVKVNPYVKRIEITGEVKRPAIFEAKEGETLQTMLDYAGGYTDVSFRDMIKAQRIAEKEREVVTVPADQIASFELKSGDIFQVDAILSRFKNRVTIAGAVFHPGDFALEENMKVGDLIKKADGIREDAALARGVIRRLQPDFSPAYINFNVQDVLSGVQSIYLHREDSVIVFAKTDLRETYHVKISGEVNKVGYYDYAENMHLEDLILLAGGLKDAASLKNVEISRRLRNITYAGTDTSVAVIERFDLNNDLKSSPDAATFVLEPFDEIMVRKSPVYNEQTNIYIEGEVLYPGVYTISSKRERISDVLKRSGGLRVEAYPEGAVLLRKTFSNMEDSALISAKLDVFYNKLEDSAAVSKLERTIQRREQLLGIQLDKIVDHPGSKYDLLLEEGDVIRVPKKLQTVQLYGEVYFPKKVRYDKSYTFRDYIRGAGGFTSQGLKRKSYVVYANGEVKSTRRTLFFNSYPKVRPGAEIYVPAKKEGRRMSPGEVVGISTGFASVALIIITILDKIK
jgi:protein involved in polysaccharide export with SLBB domain